MPPLILYKYCDPRGVDIVRNLRLKVTPPNEFNDPFELAPRMEEQLTREQALERIAEPEILQSLYEWSVQSGHFQRSIQEFEQFIAHNSEVFIKGLIQNYPASAAEFRRKNIDRVSAGVGLLCLSAVPDDILMWSHYTRSHKGFVVGFSTAHPFFASPELLEVVYREERVLVGSSVKQYDPERAEQVNALVRRKSPHWAYEKEWRQPHLLQTCSREHDPTDGTVTYFKSIDAAAIHTVILGCRICPQLEAEVRDVLQTQALSRVRLSEYDLHERDFALVPIGDSASGISEP